MEVLVILYITNLLKTLFIIVIIFYLIKIIARYVLPLLVQRGMKSMQQKMQDQFGGQQQPSRREGDVTVERKRNGRPGNRPHDGEYIDFEEVD